MKPAASRAMLLVLCATAAIVSAAEFFGASGFGGAPPWLGIWGNTEASSGVPFQILVRSTDPGGASDRAGIRAGDLIDVRRSALIERFSLFGQPLNGRAVTLWLRRGSSTIPIAVVPQPIDLPRRWDALLNWPGMVWLVCFAGLIAWRRSNVREMRMLALVLVSLAFWMNTDRYSYAAPWTWTYVAAASLNAFGPLSVALWAAFAGCFAEPLSPLRKTAARICYAFVAVAVVLHIAQVFAIVTLQIDPVALFANAVTIPLGLGMLAALACSVLAIAASARSERQRASWLLIPPAVLFFAFYGQKNDQPLVTSYAAWLALNYLSVFIIFATPVVLTYVALSRRLMDIGFVLNRAVVFGIVSTIVVGAFVLAEWITSEWFVNASHTSGALAGAAVALALGLSMRFIHKYVDRFVDRVFFRKRHEDEAALRDFAHEAAYITDQTILLERAVTAVRKHTDAGSADILITEGTGLYSSTGTNGVPATVLGENDPVIVALRAWRKPVDLHRVDGSALAGELAFPMISRGELVGTLVCGPKRDGEAYAPDESDALLALAHGVGTALDALSKGNGSSDASLRATLEQILERQDAMMRRLQDG